jgi:adenine-specific DNA-methyltransferase
MKMFCGRGMCSQKTLKYSSLVHPKVLIDDLLARSQEQELADVTEDRQLDLFADFNGLPKDATGTDFYQHDAHWTNRMILGDSLQVMASLAEREESG